MVIHCKGGDDRHAHVRRVIKEEGGGRLRVYVHCFVGGEDNLKKWVINFPRVVFGLGMLGVREGLGGWVAGRPDRVVWKRMHPIWLKEVRHTYTALSW